MVSDRKKLFFILRTKVWKRFHTKYTAQLVGFLHYSILSSSVCGSGVRCLFDPWNQNKQNNLQFCEIYETKKLMTTNFFFTPLFWACFWIRDPRSGIRDPRSGIRDPRSGMGKKRIREPDKYPGIKLPDPEHCFQDPFL
jgi:hypothetical protein